MDRKIVEKLEARLSEFPKSIIDLVCDYLDPRNLIVELSSTGTWVFFEKQNHLHRMSFVFTPTKGVYIGGFHRYYSSFGLVNLPSSFFERYFARKTLWVPLEEEFLAKLKTILRKKHRKLFISVGEKQRDKIEFSLLLPSARLRDVSDWTICVNLSTGKHFDPDDEDLKYSELFPSQLASLEHLPAAGQRIGNLFISRNLGEVSIQLREKCKYHLEHDYAASHNFVSSFGTMIRVAIGSDNEHPTYIVSCRKDGVIVRGCPAPISMLV